jgi:hypothetical protein
MRWRVSAWERRHLAGFGGAERRHTGGTPVPLFWRRFASSAGWKPALPGAGAAALRLMAFGLGDGDISNSPVAFAT